MGYTQFYQVKFQKVCVGTAHSGRIFMVQLQHMVKFCMMIMKIGVALINIKGSGAPPSSGKYAAIQGSGTWFRIIIGNDIGGFSDSEGSGIQAQRCGWYMSWGLLQNYCASIWGSVSESTKLSTDELYVICHTTCRLYFRYP